MALLTACADDAGKPKPMTVPLADLPLGSRVVRSFRGQPVEFQRTGTGVTARSLLCTHTGCAVLWQPDLDRYKCACHEGLFDANGNVLAGQPPKPLPAIPVRIEGALVVVESLPAPPPTATPGAA